MTEYATDPEVIQEFMNARDRTTNWVHVHSHGINFVPASSPPSMVSDEDAPSYGPSESDASSSHSLPPRMLLRYDDGRPDVPVSHDSYDSTSRSPPSGSRSPSPGKTPTSATSATSSDAAGARIRGPRLTRGPRPSSTSGTASPLNRQSLVGRPSSPGSPPGTANGNGNTGGATGLKRHGSRTMSKRGSISRVSELSRRTMASDAEDEIIQ